MDHDFIFEEGDDEELLNATNFLDSYDAEGKNYKTPNQNALQFYSKIYFQI